MPEPLVLISQSDAVRTLTLNRPQALNSLTAALHVELLAALDAAADDTGVRAVVLTGAGRGFCAGQDLSDTTLTADLGAVLRRHYEPLLMRLDSMPVPVVASVNGVAAGAGANLALNCDLVIAAASASFIQAFAKIGLIPDAGGTWHLPRRVGHARAMGLAMLGDKLGAEAAERMGLIWRCVDDAVLAEETAALAARLAAMPTKALVATRHAMRAAASLSFAGALDAETTLQGELGLQHDFSEGVAAFREKRPARFTDR